MKLFASLLLLLSVYNLPAQVVDQTRLEFEEDQLTARQVGMSVTSDQRHVAFMLDNGELKVFNLNNSVFTYSHNIDVNNVLEIAFTRDDKSLIIVENNRFRMINWKTGEHELTKTYDEPIQSMRIAKYSNHFGVALTNKVDIWDVVTKIKKQTIAIKKDITIIDFDPLSPQIIISPKWTLMGNRMYAYNYETGKELADYKGKFIGMHDSNGKTFFWSYNPIPGYTVGTAIFGYGTLPKREDYQYLIAWDGKEEKNSDVGFYLTTLRIQNKVIGTVGYRGFSVFDYLKGGKIFTTKKTKRDRSAAGIEVFKQYQAYPHYQISDDKVLINAYGDNINQIYSTTQNEIIGYIFVDANGEYAVVSRDGRFDGTAGSSAKLYWSARKSSKETSLESTFDRGFTPKLIRTLLANNASIEEIDLDDEIEALPIIQITSFDGNAVSKADEVIRVSSRKKNVRLSVDITENIANLEQLKVFHNNKLVAISEDFPANQVDFNLTLTTSLGNENYIYVVGSTKSEIDTEKQKMIINYAGDADAPPRMFLVTVGINEYKNPRYNLNYAIEDANAFSSTLTEVKSPLFEEVKHLSVRNSDFTKLKMQEVLATVMDEAREQDLFIFYYAGHGVMSKGNDAPAEFFLVPHDVTQIYGRDDLLFDRAISASELKEISKNINAQKQVFILDACQSAAALDAIASRGILEEKAIAQLARSTGTFWITATGSEQFATEFETIGHGVFTYALLEGLEGKADGSNGDQKITVREISAYLEERVPELSEKHLGTPQYPSSYSFGNDFPIMIYK